MASKIISRIIGRRGYAARPSASRVADIQSNPLLKQDPKISKLPNGVVVTSLENYSPISRVAIIVKAGSRFESGHNVGIAHCLRNCAGLSTRNSTIFGITRSIEHIGGTLSVTSSREHIIYTLECIRDNLDVGIKVLSHVATEQVFKPWEINDFISRMHLDLSLYKEQPEAVLMEALHQAAFRGGLSHSLYSPDFMIGKHTSEMLQEFVKHHYTPENVTVVGHGVAHEHLEDYIQKLFTLNVPYEATGNSKYGGGEIRLAMPFPVTFAAVVAEGVGFKNSKDMLSLSVLQHLLGTGCHVKYSTGTSCKLGKAAAKCTNEPFAVSSININYSDCGLFGFCLAGHPDNMPLLITGVVNEMKNSTRNISDQDVITAKKKLKSELHIAQESHSDLLEYMGIQILHEGSFLMVADLEKVLDGLTAQDISSVASRIMKSKPAMAVVGQLHNTPHLDELL